MASIEASFLDQSDNTLFNDSLPMTPAKQKHSRYDLDASQNTDEQLEVNLALKDSI